MLGRYKASGTIKFVRKLSTSRYCKTLLRLVYAFKVSTFSSSYRCLLGDVHLYSHLSIRISLFNLYNHFLLIFINKFMTFGMLNKNIY